MEWNTRCAVWSANRRRRSHGEREREREGEHGVELPLLVPTSQAKSPNCLCRASDDFNKIFHSCSVSRWSPMWLLCVDTRETPHGLYLCHHPLRTPPPSSPPTTHTHTRPLLCPQSHLILTNHLTLSSFSAWPN